MELEYEAANVVSTSAGGGCESERGVEVEPNVTTCRLGISKPVKPSRKATDATAGVSCSMDDEAGTGTVGLDEDEDAVRVAAPWAAGKRKATYWSAALSRRK